MTLQKHANTPYEYVFTAENVRLCIVGGIVPFEYPNDFDTPDDILHTHEWYEMFFVEQGSMLCHFEGGTQSIQTGEFIIIKPGTAHFTIKTNPETTLNVFNFSFELLDSQTHVPWLSLFSFEQYVHFHADRHCSALGTLFADALGSGQGLSAGSYLFSLLTRIAYLLDPTGNLSDSPSGNSWGDSNLGRMYRLNQILQRYYKTDITLATISQELHISERQLSWIIQKQFGCSYREKITALRMEEARKLLADGESVLKTAYEVGYASVGAFHNAFVKHFGVSPGAMSGKKREIVRS